jgi:U3 small nucleolar RNA-associated protein 3
LLDGDDFGGEDDGDEDEVFGLQGLEPDEDDDGDEAIEMGEGDDKEPTEDTRSQKKKAKKLKKKEQDSESSSSEEEEETWGKAKNAYYSSNAAQLESDDEEGNELEEQEARRLQGKMREDMAEGDFGLDDTPNLDGKAETECACFLWFPFLANLSPSDLAPVPVVIIPLPQDKKSLIRHLEKTSPETLALARDWQDAVEELQESAGYLKL